MDDKFFLVLVGHEFVPQPLGMSADIKTELAQGGEPDIIGA